MPRRRRKRSMLTPAHYVAINRLRSGSKDGLPTDIANDLVRMGIASTRVVGGVRSWKLIRDPEEG